MAFRTLKEIRATTAQAAWRLRTTMKGSSLLAVAPDDCFRCGWLTERGAWIDAERGRCDAAPPTWHQLRPIRSMQAFSPIVTKPCPLQLFWPLQELLAVLHCACPL